MIMSLVCEMYAFNEQMYTTRIQLEIKCIMFSSFPALYTGARGLILM